MQTESRYSRRGVEPADMSFLLTRGVLKLLVGKPWRALLSGVGIAMAIVFVAEIFVSASIVLSTVFIAADICNYFASK